MIGTYLAILYAFQHADAALVSAVRESSIAFGAIAGVVILGEEASAAKVLGVLMVVGGVIGVKLVTAS